MATSILTRDDVEALIPDAPTQKLRTLRNHFVDEIIKIRDLPDHGAGATFFYLALSVHVEDDFSTTENLFDYSLGQHIGAYHYDVLKHLGRVLNSSVIRASSTTQAEYGTYLNDLTAAVEATLTTLGAQAPVPPVAP